MVGHALGFYHTSNAVDIMHPSALGNRSAVFSPLEQHHGAFAYTQPRGATYSEIASAGVHAVTVAADLSARLDWLSASVADSTIKADGSR